MVILVDAEIGDNAHKAGRYSGAMEVLFNFGPGLTHPCYRCTLAHDSSYTYPAARRRN